MSETQSKKRPGGSATTVKSKPGGAAAATSKPGGAAAAKSKPGGAAAATSKPGGDKRAPAPRAGSKPPRSPRSPKGKDPGGPAPTRRRRGLPWVVLGGLALVCLGLVAAFDLERVDAETDGGPWARSGDLLLLDRAAAEFGWLPAGAVVALGLPHARAAGVRLRQVVAQEGEKVGGRTVERGHVALGSGPKRAGAPQQVPLGEVEGVIRLRLRPKGERWALDFMP